MGLLRFRFLREGGLLFHVVGHSCFVCCFCFVCCSSVGPVMLSVLGLLRFRFFSCVVFVSCVFACSFVCAAVVFCCCFMLLFVGGVRFEMVDVLKVW